MRASERIKSKIKEWEGCRLTAYRCPAGVLTIGYGHTGSDVTSGLRITQATADRMFDTDMARFDIELCRWMAIDGVHGLKQWQYDALVSFAYNLGIGALRDSTLWRKVKANPNDPTIPAEFMRWVHSKGAVLPGLVKRRAEEASIYAGNESIK